MWQGDVTEPEQSEPTASGSFRKSLSVPWKSQGWERRLIKELFPEFDKH